MALLKLAGAEPALQLAQLVALEHLLGVILPERTKEVLVPEAENLEPSPSLLARIWEIGRHLLPLPCLGAPW